MDSSNFWKLDKIDKIGIALIFIIFALYSTFSCFASESESVEILRLKYTTFTQNNPTITSSSAESGVGYFLVEPGYRYTITNGSTTSDKFFGYSSEEPAIRCCCK